MKKKISLRVIRRISFYYEALLKLNLPDDYYISSTQLEDITGVSCNQVRQDFFYLGISIGKQKKGYQVKRLFKELKKILSIDTGAHRYRGRCDCYRGREIGPGAVGI
jgi:NADH/NAD ratio-sensing transcriptional regulator Rex